jgi:Rrf2 family protein
MKLSRTVASALQATLQLARSDDAGVPIPCSRLAADGRMPERFLLQILRNLVTHGILTSHRGVEGGYSLDRSPHDVSLLELIEAVDGPVVSSLPIHDGLSAESKSKVECVLKDVADLARRKLRAITLAHLLPAGDMPNTN